jgi:hypothetical protein
MKLRHKNNRTFYKKTFVSTMTMSEGQDRLEFYKKLEANAADRNYSDEGSPFKNTKGGEIKSIYLLFVPEAYGALVVPPSKQALIDGYAKIVSSGFLHIKHDTDVIEETPLSELLPPSPIVFPSELRSPTDTTTQGYIPPMQVIQPAQQSVHMKGSNQLVITYDKALYVSQHANLECEIKLTGNVKIPAALIGYKLSLRFVSKVFTSDESEAKPRQPVKKVA